MDKRRKGSESERVYLDLTGNLESCSIASVPRKEVGLRLFCLVNAGSRPGVVGLTQLGVNRRARQVIYAPTSSNRLKSCGSTYSKTEQSTKTSVKALLQCCVMCTSKHLHI